MARYFFHTDDGERHVDATGTELPDIANVRRHASVMIGRRLEANPDEIWEKPDWRLTVEDAEGEVVTVIHVDPMVSPSAAVALRGLKQA